MKTKIHLAVPLALAACVAALGVACAGDPGSDKDGEGAFSDGQRQASLTGTVSYHERLALSPEAVLTIELQDTSYADAPSQLIASQAISGPGQVPIKFDVAYDPGDIDSGNRYSVGARIVESDGRLAFINDTAYEVLTRGNPNRVEMLLVLVEPPPDLIDAGDDSGADWRQWQEVPARVIWANLIPNEPVHLLRIAYYQSIMENCARPGNQKLTLDGRDIIVRLTLMQPPETPWAAPCDDEVVELDTVHHIGTRLTSGQQYRVIVNGIETTTFTLPKSGLRDTVLAQSPIESAEVLSSETLPLQYHLRVVSGLPKGSGCSQSNGYEIRRRSPDEMDVAITHHEVDDPFVVCTADFPIIETIVPLGSDFEPGVEYSIDVNEDTPVTFLAR